jgi:hypothetical protein
MNGTAIETNGKTLAARALASVWRVFLAVLGCCGGLGVVLSVAYGYGVLCNRMASAEMKISAQEAHSAVVDQTFVELREEQADFRVQYTKDAAELKTSLRHVLRKLDMVDQ